MALTLSPQAAMAQDTAAPVATAPASDAGTAADNVADDTLDPAVAAEGSTTLPAPGADAYTPMKPTPGKGMPVDGEFGFPEQYSDIGNYALWMHNAILMPVITVISLLVLALMLFAVVRFRRGRNPTPSRTTHNTAVEVIWTVIPALILLLIAIPSIILLQKQYKSPPEDALTVKVTGYQWYWGYSYPDNGDFEVISNMLDEEEAIARGEPPQLGVDNRMVVPAGVPLRIQTTAADVIHSFAVPSLWFKLDAVPGRLNERLLTINEPGVYYGQCSELCGVRHGYMPIAVEALPLDQFNAWVRAQGGTPKGEGGQAAPAAMPEAAPPQQPESAIPGAPGAGAPPTQTAPAETAPAA